MSTVEQWRRAGEIAGQFLGKAAAKVVYGFAIGAGMVIAFKVLY